MIQFDNVTYSYQAAEEGGSPALDGVTLSIQQGEMVAILGHNGSGKSTLAKMLNGLLKPASGTVTVCGMDTSDENLLIGIRQMVGLVFQNPDNQIVATLVEEDVAFALENLGVPPVEIRERVDAALREVGMLEYREHAPHRLSGGQKQRVAIAGALAMNPQVLVMDEPTAMLDPKGRGEVMETVRRLNGRGVTVVMVTHHMNEAALCGRAVVMDKGKVVMDGTPGEIFARAEALQDIGLTVPQTVALAQGLGIDAAPLTEEECAEVIYKALRE
ncbi:MAG: energy-coupling factor transporter ATPase [Oscillospiraceae bacterium]|nr:energy-coupling factor transporter ATPase [Oscillospiraceae bacterium]